MRSCGGAVQGIRELPLSLIFPKPEISEEEDRTYHNRADGGFVYVDDGSYCSGPEHWNWNADNETSRDSVMMASLAFPNNRRRMWLTIKSSDASKVVAKCPKEQHLLNSKVLELSRPTPKSLTDSNEESNDSDTIALTSSNIPTIIWSEVQRVRMPSSNQPWTLARAKWEKQQLLADTNEEIKDAANEMKSFTGKLRGWAYINQDDNNLFEDVASNTVNLHMLAVCSESKVARSAVRCYDADGSLKSVVFLTGLLSQEGTE